MPLPQLEMQLGFEASNGVAIVIEVVPREKCACLLMHADCRAVPALCGEYDNQVDESASRMIVESMRLADRQTALEVRQPVRLLSQRGAREAHIIQRVGE